MIDTRYEKTKIVAFKYFWFIDANDVHWAPGGVANRYESTRFKHRSNDPDTFFHDTVEGRRAGLDGFACSSFHGGPNYSALPDDAFQTESSIKAYLNWLESPLNPVPDFQVFIYYDMDRIGDVEGDEHLPTAADFFATLEMHRPKFSSRNYMKHRALYKTNGTTIIDNAPVFAVYSAPVTRVDNYVDGVKLYEAAHPGETVYLIMEVTTDWTDIEVTNPNRDLVDCWHKYAPWGDLEYVHSTAWIHVGSGGTPVSHSAYDSFTVCPGGEPASGTPAAEDVLARSAVEYITAWNTVITAMAAAPANVGPDFIFVCSWDEWGEASIIAPSPTWTDGIYGYPDGLYMEITAAYATIIKGEDSRKINKFNINDGG